MSIALGYLLGVHLINQDLYNQHPVVEVNDSIMVYQNSFEKTSIAGYKILYYDNFKLRAGLTTGYKDMQEYKGQNYTVPTATSSGIGLFLVPSYEKGHFVAAIVGDSVNVGLLWRTH
jgi:hypothetical protein